MTLLFQIAAVFKNDLLQKWSRKHKSIFKTKDSTKITRFGQKFEPPHGHYKALLDFLSHSSLSFKSISNVKMPFNGLSTLRYHQTYSKTRQYAFKRFHLTFLAFISNVNKTIYILDS